MIKKIINFFINLFNNNELNEKEQQMLVKEIYRKIRES